jgi:hypothetical protein
MGEKEVQISCEDGSKWKGIEKTENDSVFLTAIERDGMRVALGDEFYVDQNFGDGYDSGNGEKYTARVSSIPQPKSLTDNPIFFEVNGPSGQSLPFEEVYRLIQEARENRPA